MLYYLLNVRKERKRSWKYVVVSLLANLVYTAIIVWFVFLLYSYELQQPLRLPPLSYVQMVSLFLAAELIMLYFLSVKRYYYKSVTDQEHKTQSDHHEHLS